MCWSVLLVLTSILFLQWPLTKDCDGNLEGEDSDVACPLTIKDIEHPVEGEIEAEGNVDWRVLGCGRGNGLVQGRQDSDHV